MIAGGQGLGLVAWQGLEARERRDPLIIGQAVQPDRRGRPVIAEADQGLRERGCPHRVRELRPERHVDRIGTIGGGDRHDPQMEQKAGAGKGARYD